MTTVTETPTRTLKDCTEPVKAAIQENLRDLKRSAVAGRHAAEDYLDETRLRVRRSPFAAVGIAAGLGALAGCMIGFTIARSRGRNAQ